MKWMRLLASCLLLISLVGCSGGNESSKESSQDTEEKSGTTEESVKENDSSEGASSEESNNANEAESDQQDESGNAENDQSDREINQDIEDQFDIISDQLVASGYAPLKEWDILKYREHVLADRDIYESQFSGEDAFVSFLEEAEKITCVEVAIPSDEEAAYEKLCSVFGACTLNIFFTQDDLQQIHDQFKNAETNTDIVVNGYSLNYSEGIDIIILGVASL